MAPMSNLRERVEALEHHTRRVHRQMRWWRGIACSLVMLGVVSVSHPSQAANFSCMAGDAACLIEAITLSNANGEVNTIRLEAGTYRLTAPFETDGEFGVGLPTITSTLTIQGASGTKTVIERAATAPLGFGLVRVAASGNLTLAALTLQGGSVSAAGAGVRSEGILAIIDSVIRRNTSPGTSCAGIASSGTLTVVRSTITENEVFAESGGGLCVGGEALILQSSIVGNRAGFGGGIHVSGSLIVQNSTIAQNSVRIGVAVPGPGGGGVVAVGGRATFINSTISHNVVSVIDPVQGPTAGGIISEGGFISLVNTILAGNDTQDPDGAPDCLGNVTSFGNNLIGDPTGCNITLLLSDLTGDPGLREFRDNGRPGNGHFPLLFTSQAIDAGNDSVCPRIDQLGRPRVGPCDIGAIRFRETHRFRDTHK
jgi:hypothetical protein